MPHGGQGLGAAAEQSWGETWAGAAPGFAQVETWNLLLPVFPAAVKEKHLSGTWVIVQVPSQRMVTVRITEEKQED